MTQSVDKWDTYKNITKNDLNLKIKLLENIICPAYSHPSIDLKGPKRHDIPLKCTSPPLCLQKFCSISLIQLICPVS